MNGIGIGARRGRDVVRLSDDRETHAGKHADREGAEPGVVVDHEDRGGHRS